MRITLERDGRKETVEVGPEARSVTVGGREYPVTVVKAGDFRVELEIAGEKVVVEQWPAHYADPPGPVDVNGERWKVGVERSSTGPATGIVASSAAAPAGGPASPAAAGPAGAGAVVPPMPGKILEVRVADGDRVRQGDVLLVLEAMKMRNEVVSPSDGVVRRLRVAPGVNVRAREPMLYVEPA